MGLIALAIAWGVLAWCWAPVVLNRSESRDAGTDIALSIWAGWIGLTTIAMGLGLADAFTPVGQAVAVSVLAFAGWFRHRASRRPAAALWIPLLLLLFTAWSPNRSEWILGGWDPGIYQGQGAALARTGGFTQNDGWFHEEFSSGERDLFLRRASNRKERFPGVLSRGDAIEFEFFKLHPSGIALAHRAGGLPLSRQLNVLYAGMALLMAWALGRRVHGGAHAGWAWAFTLATTPLFLYHTGVPVSEMLQLTTVLALGLALADHRPGWVFIAMIAAVANRFSFLPLGGFLLVWLAFADWIRDKVEHRPVVWSGAAGLAFGALLDLSIAPTSILGWSVTPILLAVSGGCLALITLFTATRVPARLSRCWHSRIAGFTPWCVAVGTLVLLVASWVWAKHPDAFSDPRNADNLVRLIPFVGKGWALLGLGALALAPTLRRASATTVAWTLWLLMVLALLLYSKNVADLYPWALRRYHPQTLLLLPLAAGLWVQWAHGRFHFLPRLRIAIMWCPLALAALLSASQSIDALRKVEYRGLASRIDELAEAVPDDVIVVCDDPRWGMPLMLLHGKNVLNGKALWEDKSGNRMARALDALDGKPVVWFTSLETGMDLYPEPPDHQTLWRGETFVVQELIQHPRAEVFQHRDVERVFSLHRLSP